MSVAEHDLEWDWTGIGPDDDPEVIPPRLVPRGTALVPDPPEGVVGEPRRDAPADDPGATPEDVAAALADAVRLPVAVREPVFFRNYAGFDVVALVTAVHRGEPNDPPTLNLAYVDADGVTRPDAYGLPLRRGTEVPHASRRTRVDRCWWGMGEVTPPPLAVSHAAPAAVADEAVPAPKPAVARAKFRERKRKK